MCKTSGTHVNAEQEASKGEQSNKTMTITTKTITANINYGV